MFIIVRIPENPQKQPPFTEAHMLPVYHEIASAHCEGLPIRAIVDDRVGPGIHAGELIGKSQDGGLIVQVTPA